MSPTVSPAAVPPKQSRRPRGEPRRLLLAAARDLFARQDYRSTTTREIAEAAGVAEHLLFRNFGSKAALFREALVAPFVEVVAGFAGQWSAFVDAGRSPEEVAREFLGDLYDLFVTHRGLIVTLWTADALDEVELAETGIADIDRALAVLSGLGAEGVVLYDLGPASPDLAARSSVAMVAGMAAFGSTFFGGRRPSRAVIVEELTQATLHGFLHRGETR